MLPELIKVARGERQADLVLRNANVIDVYNSDIVKTDVAIWKDKIVGLGPGYKAHKDIDLTGYYLSPGFIDAHVHIESSMVEVPQFTRAVLPLGTTSVVADPHEIANVLGYEGIRYMMESSKYNPLNVFFMLSSCVPSSDLETAGSEMRAFDIFPLMREKWVLGLAEMMNYPGVLQADPIVLDKLQIVENKRIDGHAPGLLGRDLNAYIAAGIESDHECTTRKEAEEKLRRGMHIMIREGTGAKNLQALLPLVNSDNERRFMFCTDDRHPNDILKEGHINYIIKTAIQQGCEPVTAIRLATLNAAEYFGLSDLGAISPGKTADLVAFDNFEEFNVHRVFKNGQEKVLNSEPIYELPVRPKIAVRSSVNLRWLEGDEFHLPAQSDRARVIRIIPDQIVTEEMIASIPVIDGAVVSDTERDLLKLFVIERHRASGNIGRGIVQGFGLKRGAIASTISHDSHNIIVVGVNDNDMMKAVITLNKMGGGIAIVVDDHVVESLELPIAGLMSQEPLERVSQKMNALTKAAHSLGVSLTDPLMTLSFMALPVIPKLKLTDKGLVDVERFERVGLFV